MPIIEVDHISKSYRAQRGGRVLLGRGGLSDLLRRKKVGTVHALDNVSFDVEPGESLGIIGANGSGKSTLLKIIAGVTVPTTGTVRVRGRVASLLELGAGFHPMLTGRENVYLNAGILGMRHAEVDAIFEEIVAFSGIGDFIDYPVDTYSSGMFVRIGFAVAAYTNPDIFLIDEVLSVGDEEFQRRCRMRIGELIEQNKTIVFVSHDLSIINTLCQRVVLMSAGKMILRDSARKAVDFYLRQVGAEKGLHTLEAVPLEAIVCNGRVSMFHNQDEITGASGFGFRIFSMGNWHYSYEADWEIIEREKTRCTAHGRLSKLPILLIWSVTFDNGELIWRLALECDKKCEIDFFQVNLFFPKSYTSWVFDDDGGPFPDILPEHVNWEPVCAPEVLCEEVAFVPSPQSTLPPVSVRVDSQTPNLRGYITNTDYMTGCRMLQLEGHLTGEGEMLPVGHRDIATLHINASGDRQTLDQKSRLRVLDAGRLQARFERGRLRLSVDGKEITTKLHLYASILIGNLWNDSQTLRWEGIERDGDVLRLIGASRRFPLRLHWTLKPDAEAIALEIELEALDTLEVQEHHTSVVLLEQYERWETQHESGTFPPIDPELGDWQHLNKNYAPGTFARASGKDLPTITLETDADNLRLTAINTSYQERARVLQALRTPDHGILTYEKGRHPYFHGRLSIQS